MGDLPPAVLAAVHLRRAEGVAARLSADRRRSVLEAGGIGHVADDVVRQQLEAVRRAVREAFGERGEELVQLLLAVGVAPRAEDADGAGARPERPARPGIAVVQGDLCVVERGSDPGQEVVTVAHANRPPERRRSLVPCRATPAATTPRPARPHPGGTLCGRAQPRYWRRRAARPPRRGPRRRSATQRRSTATVTILCCRRS